MVVVVVAHLALAMVVPDQDARWYKYPQTLHSEAPGIEHHILVDWEAQVGYTGAV